MPYKSITCKAYGIQKLPHEFSYETFFGNYCNFFKILPFLNMFFQQQPSKIIRRNFCLKNTETLGKFCLFAVVPTWERPVFCDPCAIHLLQQRFCIFKFRVFVDFIRSINQVCIMRTFVVHIFNGKLQLCRKAHALDALLQIIGLEHPKAALHYTV